MDFTVFQPADFALATCMFAGAALYTSVGHAGASAYIALMALFGLPAPVMRPTALVLNILVASLSSFRFLKAGLFRWRTLWPVLIGAIPMAFIGGSLHLPGQFYKPLVGAVLLVAAARLLWNAALPKPDEVRDIPVPLGIVIGAAIGLLSGLTGTGGGIFLSPILLFFGWSDTRTASGVAGVFILCNSVAGLLGNFASVQSLPPELPLFAIAVILGGVLGTSLGIGKLATPNILRALGVVLAIAGAKLIGAY